MTATTDTPTIEELSPNAPGWTRCSGASRPKSSGCSLCSTRLRRVSQRRRTSSRNVDPQQASNRDGRRLRPGLCRVSDPVSALGAHETHVVDSAVRPMRSLPVFSPRSDPAPSPPRSRRPARLTPAISPHRHRSVEAFVIRPADDRGPRPGADHFTVVDPQSCQPRGEQRLSQHLVRPRVPLRAHHPAGIPAADRAQRLAPQ
jgi:hypothetical protein